MASALSNRLWAIRQEPPIALQADEYWSAQQ